jgi:ribosome-binding protein aMBF1 (putative translation factor)
MSTSPRSDNKDTPADEPRDSVGPALGFDRDLAAKIGKCITVRRNLCGLSRQQLGARLGIDSTEMEAYERGAKRLNCRVLLQVAKQLNATPRFFFQ